MWDYSNYVFHLGDLVVCAFKGIGLFIISCHFYAQSLSQYSLVFLLVGAGSEVITSFIFDSGELYLFSFNFVRLAKDASIFLIFLKESSFLFHQWSLLFYLFLISLISGFVFNTSFLLLVSAFSFFSSFFLCYKLRLLICNFCFFLMFAFNARNIFLGDASLDTFHIFFILYFTFTQCYAFLKLCLDTFSLTCGLYRCVI